MTCLKDYFFTAPFKIAKPFLDEKTGVLNIIIMSASAGIMEGDCYRTRLELGTNARVALQGQSYTKIHRMQDGQASQFNQFILAEGAFLDYTQQPTIPYAGSSYQSVSEWVIHNLTKTKRFGLIVRILGGSSDHLSKVLFDLKQEIYKMFI